MSKNVQKSEKMENFSKSWKFLTKLKLKKCTNC
jgi:hypothetical protein